MSDDIIIMRKKYSYYKNMKDQRFVISLPVADDSNIFIVNTSVFLKTWPNCTWTEILKLL